MRALVITNPTSGQATAEAFGADLAERLTADGWVVERFVTAAAGQARVVAAGSASTVDLLVCVGGDGTLNEVVNGVLDAGAQTPILPVALGTANVVARELGLPTTPADLARLATAGQRRPFDIGLVERPHADQQRFVMCLGAGFDAEVVARVHAARDHRGITQRAYVRPLLAALARGRRPPVVVTADGQTLTERAALVIVANLSRYGGERVVCRQARPDDGLLDLCWVDGPSRAALLRFVLGWLRGGLRADGCIHFARAATVDLSSSGIVPVQVDGDPAGWLPVTVSVLPGAVTLVGPTA